MTQPANTAIDARMKEHRAAAGLNALRLEKHHGVAVHRYGSGPPLVLLHGVRGSWNHWIRNITVLGQRFSLYVFDMPGFGCSEPVPREWPYDDYLALLARAIDRALKGATFKLAGFSFGGETAAMLTAYHCMDQVERLSLLAPAGWGNDSVSGSEQRRSLRGVTSETGRRAVFRHNLAVNQIADPLKITEETVDLLDYNIAHTVFHSPKAGSLPVLLDALAKIRCPLQILLGERDVLQLPSRDWRMARMREAAPHARTDVLPGAGHWSQYETPDAYNQRLLAFLLDPTARQ